MTSKIEWLRSADGKPGYTINPVKGLCPMACSYCYARRMYQNPYYKSMYQNQGIRFDINAMLEPMVIKRPSRIFVGSTMELFGDWIDQEWLSSIFYMCQKTPRHTFIFLTKQPQNLIKWSPFPENCWVGVSATNEGQYLAAYHTLPKIQAKVKFLSFEPLLSPILVGAESLQHMDIGWVICGQQTPVKPATAPKLEWVQSIVEAADKAGVPVFLKDNLQEALWSPYSNEGEPYNELFYRKNHLAHYQLRQEFPA